MSKRPIPPGAGLITTVRRLFHALKAAGDTLHAASGISVAMRGVMESLAAEGPRTVPALARARPVSRQHIQVLVDQLTRGGLVETRPNPAHRRSVLIALTSKGEAEFAALGAREAKPMAALFVGLDPREVAIAHHVLATLRARAATLAERGKSRSSKSRRPSR